MCEFFRTYLSRNDDADWRFEGVNNFLEGSGEPSPVRE